MVINTNYPGLKLEWGNLYIFMIPASLKPQNELSDFINLDFGTDLIRFNMPYVFDKNLVRVKTHSTLYSRLDLSEKVAFGISMYDGDEVSIFKWNDGSYFKYQGKIDLILEEEIW